MVDINESDSTAQHALGLHMKNWARVVVVMRVSALLF